MPQGINIGKYFKLVSKNDNFDYFRGLDFWSKDDLDIFRSSGPKAN